MEKCAYVTFIIRNDSFLPGALVLAYGLRRQKTRHDLVAIVSENISDVSVKALKVLYDDVITLNEIYVPHEKRHERQDRPFLFSRFHALRLGKDGDLGRAYDKVLICDADLLAMRDYDRLFELDTPAGVINEKKEYCMDYSEGQYIVPDSVDKDGTWRWHRVYEDYPMNARIPKAITDRVLHDNENMGVNAALYLLDASMALFEDIKDDLRNPEEQRKIARFPWPEMQYITQKLSGQWHNMDLRFSSFNGYPKIDVLYGIHYAGLKPWQMNHRSIRHFARFEDYRLWYRVFKDMVEAYPALKESKKIVKLYRWVTDLTKDADYQFKRTDIPAVRALFHEL